MTPRETARAVEAFGLRLEREHRARISLAWHTAALTRAKKMPPLARLIEPPPARPLEGAELERRRDEFEEMKAGFRLDGR